MSLDTLKNFDIKDELDFHDIPEVDHENYVRITGYETYLQIWKQCFGVSFTPAEISKALLNADLSVEKNFYLSHKPQKVFLTHDAIKVLLQYFQQREQIKKQELETIKNNTKSDISDAIAESNSLYITEKELSQVIGVHIKKRNFGETKKENINRVINIYCDIFGYEPTKIPKTERDKLLSWVKNHKYVQRNLFDALKKELNVVPSNPMISKSLYCFFEDYPDALTSLLPEGAKCDETHRTYIDKYGIQNPESLSEITILGITHKEIQLIAKKLRKQLQTKNIF